MTRRNWLHISTLALAGSLRAQTASTAINAGSFLVTVPDGWAETAIIQKVPLAPLYSKEDWKAYQADKTNILKPAYGNRPQHWAIRLPRARLQGKAFDAKTAGDDETAPQILIHKADEWGLAMTDGVHEEISAEKVVRKLREEQDQWRTKDLPHGSPAFLDAELHFICLKKPLKFQGGEGIRMVAQWTIEADVIRRGRLHYLFLGMSADNTCQIIATFPLDLAGLPAETGDAEHLGRSTKRDEELTKGFDRYEGDAKKWLESRAVGLTPSLESLDEIVQSMVVRRWQ